jgi:hypothetical protein
MKAKKAKQLKQIEEKVFQPAGGKPRVRRKTAIVGRQKKLAEMRVGEQQDRDFAPRVASRRGAREKAKQVQPPKPKPKRNIVDLSGPAKPKHRRKRHREVIDLT